MTFEEWIARDGLARFKIKLNGGHQDADFERIVRIDRLVRRVLPGRGVTDWKYLLDFNEGCPNVAYLHRAARAREGGDPGRFRARALHRAADPPRSPADRANVMHEAAKLRPVVIDESLTDLEALLLAREMGYTGVALKACKGQSQAMLMAAAAQKFGMFLCVQDLTCPGASLIHSAGIAARVPGNAGIEANARQFVPAANAAMGVALSRRVHDSQRDHADRPAHRPGLGAVPPRQTTRLPTG